MWFLEMQFSAARIGKTFGLSGLAGAGGDPPQLLIRKFELLKGENFSIFLLSRPGKYAIYLFTQYNS